MKTTIINVAMGIGAVSMLSLTSAQAQNACETYTIKQGDTLSKISQSAFDTPFRFDEILAANSEALSQGADIIRPGVEISIPCDTAVATKQVSDDFISSQRDALAASTLDKGFGPQSPRDLDTLVGENTRIFNLSLAPSEMNLCNIHFHEGAEHRGGQFKTYAGNGNGKG